MNRYEVIGVDTNYTPDFYDKLRTGVVRSAAIVAPLVHGLAQPRSVIDVGCGTGGWLTAFKEVGVADVLGVDGPWVGSTLLAPDEFQQVDLSQPLEVGRRFDLAVSLEVAEHLPAAAAATFVRSLTGLAPLILFSAAVPEQGGTDHVNEQWPEYWAGLFRVHGYRPIDCVRPAIWNSEDVEWWYVQNTIVYACDEALAARSALRAIADRTDPDRLSLIHPRHYLEKVQSRELLYYRPDPDRFPLSTLLSVAPRVFANAVRRRIRAGRRDQSARPA